ncbi:hypothetical protein D3C80_2143440 [compost metagenome]
MDHARRQIFVRPGQVDEQLQSVYFLAVDGRVLIVDHAVGSLGPDHGAGLDDQVVAKGVSVSQAASGVFEEI